MDSVMITSEKPNEESICTMDPTNPTIAKESETIDNIETDNNDLSNTNNLETNLTNKKFKYLSLKKLCVDKHVKYEGNNV